MADIDWQKSDIGFQDRDLSFTADPTKGVAPLPVTFTPTFGDPVEEIISKNVESDDPALDVTKIA